MPVALLAPHHPSHFEMLKPLDNFSLILKINFGNVILYILIGVLLKISENI
jgi:hypothetical protein